MVKLLIKSKRASKKFIARGFYITDTDDWTISISFCTSSKLLFLQLLLLRSKHIVGNTQIKLSLLDLGWIPSSNYSSSRNFLTFLEISAVLCSKNTSKTR